MYFQHIIKFYFKVSACKMGRLLIGSTAIMRNASPCFFHHERTEAAPAFILRRKTGLEGERRVGTKRRHAPFRDAMPQLMERTGRRAAPARPRTRSPQTCAHVQIV